MSEHWTEQNVIEKNIELFMHACLAKSFVVELSAIFIFPNILKMYFI